MGCSVGRAVTTTSATDARAPNTRHAGSPGSQRSTERDLERSSQHEPCSCGYQTVMMKASQVVREAADGSEDAAKKAAEAEDRFYNNQAFEKTDIDVGNAQHQEAATSIQSKYRQHHATKVVQEKREERAATSIQASFRGYQDRQLVKGMKGGSVVADKAEDDANLGELELESDASAKDKQAKAEGFKSRQIAGEVEEEVDIDLNDPETEKAAICIQAGYKGYKSRKEVTAIKKANLNLTDGDVTEVNQASTGDCEPSGDTPSSQPVPHAVATTTSPQEGQDIDEVVDIDLDDPEVEKAAVLIQAGFKSFASKKKQRQLQANEDDGTEEKVYAPPFTRRVLPQLPPVHVPGDSDNESYDGTRDKDEQARPRVKENDDDDEDLPPTETAADVAGGGSGDKPPTGENHSSDSGEPRTAGEPSEGNTAVGGEGVKVEADEEEEVVDIDLEDPEVEKAAVLIQGGFKGFKARKKQQQQQQQVLDNEQQEIKPKTLSFADNETPAVGGDEPQTETAPAGDDGVDDIDLNDPEVEAAAIAIQAGYKGFKARKSLKGGDEEVAEDSKPEAAEVKAGEEEEEIDIDLEDPEVEAAAIKIQASFKGFKSRKEQQNEAEPEEGKVEQAADGDKPAEEVNQAEGKPETVAEPSAEESAKPQQEQEEEIDIDLNDPEVEDAAIKIQAGFKNFKQRQSIKAENVETDPAEPAAPTEEPVPEATDGDVKDEA